MEQSPPRCEPQAWHLPIAESPNPQDGLIPSVEAASFCGSIIESTILSGRQPSCENLEAAAKLLGCLSLMPVLMQPRGRRYSRSRNIHAGNGCRARLEKQAGS